MTQIIHNSNGGGGSSDTKWGSIKGVLANQIDLKQELDKKADDTDISKVGKSNDYEDLDNKPTIGKANLTIKQNGETKGTFNANATSGTEVNITVPTNNNQLTNGANYITKEVNNLTNYTLSSNLKSVATSGSFNDLSDTDNVQKVDNMVTTLDNADDTHYPTSKAVADAMSGAGLGDMMKSVYDPTNKNGDAFDAQKHHNLDTALSLTSEQAVQNKVITAKINDIELSKSPNVSIVGEPTIVNGNISGFSASNYLIAPFLSSFAGYPFTFHMDITTGTDITTQQNIIDAEYGMAFAIKNGKFVIALSTNGTSWDLGEHTGTYTVKANTSYCVELAWSGTVYTVKVSIDRVNFTTDITVNSSSALSGNTLYLGGHGVTDHPFKGTFNFNEWQFLSGTIVVWKGMDDAGLSTRANLSLSNLNAQGENKLESMKGGYFLKEDVDYTVEYDATKGVAPYNTSYGYTNITITNPLIKEKLGAIYQFSINTKPATSTYRNVRVRFGESGDWYGLGAYSSVSAQYSYFTKAYPCFFVFKESSATATTDKYFSGVFVNTTYSSMTASEASTGTATSARTMTAKVLADEIGRRLDAYHDDTKQNTISDLETIRSGASAGATALQSFTETDPVYSNSPAAGIGTEDINNWNSKQDSIADLGNIRTRAENSIQNPTGGTSGQVLTKTETGTEWKDASGGIISETVTTIRTGTSAEYEAITTKDVNTLYFVKE